MTTIWHWIKIGLIILLAIGFLIPWVILISLIKTIFAPINKILKKKQPPEVEVISESNPESSPLDNLTTRTHRRIPLKRPGYPNTYPVMPVDSRIERPEVFDPALWHFSGSGFRLGEPLFQEADLQARWLMARQQVMEHVLCVIQDSPWHDHLVLRGSLLLKAWLGDQAREPGDMDWVFRPITIGLNNPLTETFFQDLIVRISQQSQVGDVTIDVNQIAIDDIWTYERAQGRRLLFPWKAEGLPDGTMQMDITFGEDLVIEPIQTLMPTWDGRSVSIWSVTPALSLAWKLRWLEADRYPQGKDLYDAVLLAESIHLPFELLRRVLESSPEWCSNVKYSGSNFSWRSGFPWFMDIEEMDWDLFQREYPWVEGTAIDWLTRLQVALAKTVHR